MAGIAAGISGLSLCATAALAGSPQFFISYLFGYLFWLGLALGCLGAAMIHYLTGGRWGDVTRRLLEAGFMTLPLMALLFAPILFGLNHLYPWARAADVAADKILQNKAAYMNIPAFYGRTVFYFAVWIILAGTLRTWSLQQDQTADVTPTRWMRTLSGPGIVIYPLTVTFAYIDWVMSIEPDWYSTIFPVIICIGQILAAFAFVTCLLAWFKNHQPLCEVVTATQFQHLGNLLLAFVMFWAYASFSQFLIIWSGNLPNEIVWYRHRMAGNWKWIVWFLVLFHFLLPFFLLLFRASKQRAGPLAMLAGMILAARMVDVFWLVNPSFYHSGIQFHWLDFAALFGMGGLWIAMFIAMLKRGALLPHNDPRIQLAAAHG